MRGGAKRAITQIFLAVGVSAASASVLPPGALANTDWKDSLTYDAPFRDAGSVDACIAVCAAEPECVAVSFNAQESQGL